MSNLILHLKKRYFNDIKLGIKDEEFRICNKYWLTRLEGKNFDEIILCCGYPKMTDTNNIIRRKYSGFKFKMICHPEFGSEPVGVLAIDVKESRQVSKRSANSSHQPTRHAGHSKAATCPLQLRK
jgi:hypothetical protein